MAQIDPLKSALNQVMVIHVSVFFNRLRTLAIPRALRKSQGNIYGVK